MEACIGFLPDGREIVGIKQNKADGDPTTECKLCQETVSLKETVQLFVKDDNNTQKLFACCKSHKVRDASGKIIKLEELL